MARNEIHIDAPIATVFDVLADPRFFANWVVGASSVRGVEGEWPAVGSTLHHSQQLVLRDTTQVKLVDPPRRLLLEARARPLAVAEVDIGLEPDGDGTRLVLVERATGAIAGAFPELLTDPLIHIRNRASVARLKRLAEIGHQLGLD
ncbi:MAG: hypothetical protein QOK21_3888 [Solirubrobacteraceae bacterium]|jgi:uncharacterized protein YndB with AHSA1/START domain|nr:hypothetical protein [Solirubrobacteraceae bacterium]